MTVYQLFFAKLHVTYIFLYVGEWGWGSRLEAWMKSHKSEVAIT